MLTFEGPCPEGLEVCHGDGNKGNNVLSNLRYGTRLENAMDRALHGTDPKGERNPSAKLNEEAVADIRRRLAEGELQRLIAAAHDVTQATVSKIKRGATW
jgi:hypothetical protein